MKGETVLLKVLAFASVWITGVQVDKEVGRDSGSGVSAIKYIGIS